VLHLASIRFFKKRLEAPSEVDLVYHQLNSHFIAQIKRLLWLYALPYDCAYPVVCFDERP
jgi:hypothetical protein